MAIANLRLCNSQERNSVLRWEQNLRKPKPRAHQPTEGDLETSIAFSEGEQATAPSLCCSKLETESIPGRIKKWQGICYRTLPRQARRYSYSSYPRAATLVMYTFYLAGTLAEELDYAI